MSLKVLVLGATGETGSEVLKALLGRPEVEKIVLVGRRKIEAMANEAKVEERIVNFDSLESDSSAFSGVSAAFCCLGTTRGKAGKEGFVKVDHDYVLNAAKLLKAEGCQDFHLLTSKGSNANSWFLYPATKGKVEEAVKALDFARTAIYRPGLLMCDRQESRPGEKMMRSIAGVLDRGSKVSISTADLGRVMVVNALKASNAKVEVFEHSDMVKMASENK